MLASMANRNYRHLTPRYIVNRLRLMAYERRHPDDPWLTADAVRWLDRWLRPQHEGLEWGCGRSTIWFARRVAGLTSAESDADWYTRVQERLADAGLAEHISIRLTQHEAAYVGISEGIEVVDFALVDGIASIRAECALSCIEKIRAGGIIIVDNVNWFIPRERPSHAPNSRRLSDGYANSRWEEFHHLVTDWPVVWTTNGVTDTAIWTKPE